MKDCFELGLSKKQQIIILVIGIVAILGLGILPTQLSIYSYAKEVPIQLGYNEVQNYWVLSSVISEKETFKMVLHSGDTEPVSSETEAKAESEVGLMFGPLAPFSKTNLEVKNWEFRTTVLGYTKVPAYDVNDAGWLTTARYTIAIYKEGNELSRKEVNINYKESRVIQLETSSGTVTINNLGMLPQGVEVPSGDLVIVNDPYGDYQVWSQSDLDNFVDWWNSRGYFYAPFKTVFSWTDVWIYAYRTNQLPSEVNLVHISEVTYQGNMDYMTLYYSDIVFAGDITVYIPSELADTVIINLFQPKPEITSITTDPAPVLGQDLPSINEGDFFTLSMTIKNVGTEGTISVSLTSERYGANAITMTSFTFKEDESLTFRWKVYALNVAAKTDAELKVFAQGRGGTDERILLGIINDVPGYTPPNPPPPDEPIPPSPSSAFPWEILIVAIAGAIVIFYFMRRHKRK